MMKFVLPAVALLAATSALAQQQFTPTQQAAMSLGQQLGLAMQNAAELAAQIQTLNAQIAEKDKRIRELEAKKPEAAK